jgi:hypothetical protein
MSEDRRPDGWTSSRWLLDSGHVKVQIQSLWRNSQRRLHPEWEQVPFHDYPPPSNPARYSWAAALTEFMAISVIYIYIYFNLGKIFALCHGPIKFAIKIKVLEIQVFWVVMLSHLVNSFWSYSILKCWQLCTQQHDRDLNHQQPCCKNLKSHTLQFPLMFNMNYFLSQLLAVDAHLAQ